MLELDWRNPDDYAYAERQFSPHDWAWEFLRRNKDYRTAWEEFLNAKGQLEANPGVPGLVARAEEARARSRQFGLLDFRDPKLGAGLISPNPFVLSPNWLAAVGVKILIEQALEAVDPIVDPWPGYPQSIALSFSFAMPIEPQITHASELLRDYSNRARDEAGIRPPKPTVRFDSKRFTLYARLLDASSENTPIGEMGRVLFMGRQDKRKSAKGALAKARQLAASGYRDLLLMADV